jgi:hypothetical protein
MKKGYEMSENKKGQNEIINEHIGDIVKEIRQENCSEEEIISEIIKEIESDKK